MSNKKSDKGGLREPKLRFPQYRGTGGWEDSTVGSICHLQAGKFVAASDIFDETAADLYPCYGGNGLRGYVKSFTHSGKFPLIGRQGALCGNVRLAQGQFHATEHAVVASAAKNVDVDWLFYELDFLNLNQFATGQAQPGLSIDVIDKVPVIKPAQEKEQRKIADCLASLDELNVAQSHKLDALKIYKKGLLQQLFPCEGQALPSLRFPEFRNVARWKPTKISALSQVGLSNGVFNDPRKVGSGYKLVNVSDMYIDTTINEDRLSLLQLSKSEFEGNQVERGDIFFTRSSLVKSGIAVSNIYLGNADDVTFDGHLIRFRPDTNKIIPLFAHYLFKTSQIRKQLIARGKTATMTTIGQSDVAGVELNYPEKDEQQKIADCLFSLDEAIVAQRDKLDALKCHKRGLIQQLFLASGGK